MSRASCRGSAVCFATESAAQMQNVDRRNTGIFHEPHAAYALEDALKAEGLPSLAEITADESQNVREGTPARERGETG